MNGRELLNQLEKHCEEELTCSHRLRFQIEESITRLIESEESLRLKIQLVLNGHNVYDPKLLKVTSKTRYPIVMER